MSLICTGEVTKCHLIYEFGGVIKYWRYSRAKMLELNEKGLIVQAKPGAIPQRKQYSIREINMQDDSLMNRESMTAVLARNPRIDVYLDLDQAASALYGGAPFVDWDGLNQYEDISFAVKGGAEGTVLYHWALNSEESWLYQLGVFRHGEIVDAGLKGVRIISDVNTFLEFVSSHPL